MTIAHAPLRLSTCHGDCGAATPHRAHHDRLLTVDTDPDALLELIELAVTWHELEYSREPVIGPADWMTFAERHSWTLPDRAAWIFGLALDIVGRRLAGPPDAAGFPAMLELVRG